MSTLVVSDLHLGARGATDMLRRAEPLAALCAAARGVERLVILGDAIELRHGPAREALHVARPVLAALGEALGSGGELVLVAGNHDHALVAPWLAAREVGGLPPRSLRLEERADDARSPVAAALVAAAAPARVRVAYPGVWLRDDVYALHGHYVDRLLAMPTLERVAAGLMSRVVGPLPSPAATPEDFEAALAPLYAWLDAVARAPRGDWSSRRQSASADVWRVLTTGSRRSPRVLALRAAVVAGVTALNRLGAGPLDADLSPEHLRRSGLAAMAEVVRRLQVDAAHVVFGHTHRAGPMDGDDPAEWRVGPAGALLHNAGAWVDERLLGAGRPGGPYAGGRALLLGDSGPPRLVQVA